jgi:hypothetical protein
MYEHRPSSANESVVFWNECESTCADGWMWLNAAEWHEKCLEKGLSRERCDASVYPQLTVAVSSATSFQRDGVPIVSGQFLGTRSEQYSFGGCWPCKHLYHPDCKPGYGALNPCLRRKTGGRSSDVDNSDCRPCEPGTYKSADGSATCSRCEAGKNSGAGATTCS